MADPLPLEPMMADTSGISEEDQRDITAQIDRVAQQNRIQAGPEAFAIKARKKGLLVPLAVNLGALVVLVTGLLVLWLLFRQGAETLVQNQVVLQSAEGKLLEEVRKQSESQLLAKDQQIADIQKRMESLAQQKNDLQSTMDDKIAARETELKAQLQEALEAERKRLAAAGFSQAVIEEKLKAFEKQKNAEFQQQLADFRKKAETERQGLEANLKKQQDDYQKNLSDLAGDRQRILDDSKKRQGELQAQLDQKNRDLDAQQSASKAQLAQAQAQLNDLNDQRTRTESVENQLLGLYTKSAQAIQSRQFPEALKQVAALVSFLNEPTVKSLPGIQKRRDADLFLAATLADWLTQDQKRLDADSARVQTTQSALDTIQTLAQQAQAAQSAGKLDESEALYNKALAEVPAVLEAHQYFLDKALKLEQTRQATVASALAEGDAALAAGNPDAALTSYAAALDALPLTSAQKTALPSHWGQVGFDSQLADKTGQLDTSSQRDLASAQALVKSDPVSALAAYVAIVGKYPVGQVGFASLTGIRQASAQLQGPSPREASLSAELDKVKADLATTRQQLASRPVAPATPAATGADPAALQAAQAEAAKLRPDAVALQTMAGRFKDFVTQDTPLWAGTPDSGQVLQSKLLLNSFLASPEVSTAFPGLSDKVGRYEKAALEAGQKEGLINVGDAVANLAQLTTTEERQLYLTGLQRRYAGNPAMAAVLKSLGTLF